MVLLYMLIFGYWYWLQIFKVLVVMLFYDVLDGIVQVNSGIVGGVEVDGYVLFDGNDVVVVGWIGSFRVFQDFGEIMD